MFFKTCTFKLCHIYTLTQYFCLQAACLAWAVVHFEMCSLNSSCWLHVHSYAAALYSIHWACQWGMINLKNTLGLLALYDNPRDLKTSRKSLISGNNSINLPKNLPLLNHLTSAADLCAQHHCPPGEHGKTFLQTPHPNSTHNFYRNIHLLHI